MSCVSERILFNFPIDWLKQVLQLHLNSQHCGRWSKVSCLLGVMQWGTGGIVSLLQNYGLHQKEKTISGINLYSPSVREQGTSLLTFC